MRSPELPETTEWTEQPGAAASVDFDAATHASLTRVDLGMGTTAPDSEFDHSECRDEEDQIAGQTAESNPNPDANLGRIVELEVDGQTLSFQIDSFLGVGGMGKVYAARAVGDPEFTVAIKISKNKIADQIVASGSKLSDRVQTRFEQEVEYLRELDHPNIVSFIGSGALNVDPSPSVTSDSETNGSGPICYAMELLENRTIVEYCDKHELDLKERLSLFQAVCEGVRHCHEHGIIHRDLKPGNILIQQTGSVAVPKLIDFGIAKRAGLSSIAASQPHGEFGISSDLSTVNDSKTDNAPMGTIQYMSPEQSRKEGSTVGYQSDIYSLGVLLHELVTGKTPLASEPIEGCSFDTIVERIASMPAPNLEPGILQLDVQLTSQERIGLNRLFSKTLARDSEDRYEDVHKLITDVKAVIANVNDFAEPQPNQLPEPLWQRQAFKSTKDRRMSRKGFPRRVASRPTSFGFIWSTVAACFLIMAYFVIQDFTLQGFCEDGGAVSKQAHPAADQPLMLDSGFFCTSDQQKLMPENELNQVERVLNSQCDKMIQVVQVEKRSEPCQTTKSHEPNSPSNFVLQGPRQYRVSRNKIPKLLLPGANEERTVNSNQKFAYQSNKTRWLIAPQLSEIELQKVDCDPAIQKQALQNFSLVIRKVNSGSFDQVKFEPEVTIRGVTIPGVSGLIRRIPHKTLSRCLFNTENQYRYRTSLEDF